MPADYVIFAVVAVLSVGGGLFLLRQAKNYRRCHSADQADQRGE